MNICFSSRPWFLVLTASVALPAFHDAALHAQQKTRATETSRPKSNQRRPATATARTPLPAPLSMPSVPEPININVLVLAMDDIPDGGVSVPSLPLPGARDPKTPRPPASIRPIAPAITPASWPALTGPQTEVRALAQKKPKKSRADRDAEIFRRAPEPWLSPEPAAPVGGAAAGGSGSNSASEDGEPGTSSATDGAIDAIESAPFSPVARPSGPVATAAAALHLALLRVGFQEVGSSPLDGALLQPFLNNRRLSVRVLNTLSQATRQWLTSVAGENAKVSSTATGATATSEASSADMIGAASRIGQALGYRAVIVMSLAPRLATEKPGSGNFRSTYALMIVDAQQESGEPLVFDESGDSAATANEVAASTGAAIVAKRVVTWPTLSAADKKIRADKYFADARLSLANKDFAAAQDSLNQVLSLDPNRAEAFSLLGDVMQNTDPSAAAATYRRALAGNDKDGELWAKTAIAYTIGPSPSWPEALKAGRKALALGYDTAALRQAMATAQLGRALLFRNANREERAGEAETEAREHLDRALELAPDDPSTTRLMTQSLLQQNRISEALQLLDRVAIQYPEDAEIQEQYAAALLKTPGRDEDAFAAWARARRLSGEAAAPVQAASYRRLSNGFDLRLASIGKRAGQLVQGVALNTLSRETALLQISRFKEDMSDAAGAIKAIPPSFDGQGGNLHASRILAVDLMVQALEAHQLYLETGQDLYRARANEMHRNAIEILNVARNATRTATR